MRTSLRATVTIFAVAVLALGGWLAYGEFGASAAADFDQSVGMVYHQTDRMSGTLGDTKTFVETEVAAITSISALLAEWTPKYNSARSAYTRFDAAIVAAEARAEDYFASQRLLTERYHDPERRASAEQRDESDYALYEQWRGQAHSARDNAWNILKRLDDMDTDLRKLELTSEFSFDSGKFREVPLAITSLDDELEQFQAASENIREITASPFELP